MTAGLSEAITDSLGYQIINEDGAVLFSGGELEYNEAFAAAIMKIVTNISGSDVGLTEPIKRMNVIFSDYSLNICLSNRKVHVIKKRFEPPTTAEEETS